MQRNRTAPEGARTFWIGRACSAPSKRNPSTGRSGRVNFRLGMTRPPPATITLQRLLDALESAGLGLTVNVDHGDRLERVYANGCVAELARAGTRGDGPTPRARSDNACGA